MFAQPELTDFLKTIKHYRFAATHQLRTPLAILNRHGETHPGPLQAVPKIASEQDGIWLPVLKSWAELAGPNVAPEVLKRLQAVSTPPEMMASDVGPIPSDGGKYLPFLKAFRSIVESSATSDEKRSGLCLLASNSEFREYALIHAKKLESWPL
jgi:hypothetical protein